jgi:hypothetical protein
MSRRVKDYIPTKDAEFGPWALHLIDYVAKMCAEVWTHIPPEALDALAAQIDDWDLTYDTAIKTPTSANNSEKRRIRTASDRAVRGFVNHYLRFPPVTDYDRDQIGVRSNNKVRSPIALIREPPAIAEVTSRRGQLVVFHFRPEGVEKSQKIPYGHNGAVLFYTYGDKPVTDEKELIHSVLMGKSPYTLTALPPEASGKILSYNACWQKEGGDCGSRSSIEHVVVL